MNFGSPSSDLLGILKKNWLRKAHICVLFFFPFFGGVSVWAGEGNYRSPPCITVRCMGDNLIMALTSVHMGREKAEGYSSMTE